MLTGDKVILRARLAADAPVLHTELYEDVDGRSRDDDRAWRPIPVDSPDSPYAFGRQRENADIFSVVDRADDELAGGALLWGINLHCRYAHIGIALRPGHRGRGLGTDALRVLCDYAFRTRGLHRLQIETLADNDAMLASAERVGFVREGVSRQSEWVQGEWIDLVTLGLLADEWWAARG